MVKIVLDSTIGAASKAFLIKELLKISPSTAEFVFKNNELQDEDYSYILQNMNEYLEKMNDFGVISDYLSGTKQFNIGELDVPLFKKLSEQKNIKIENLQCIRDNTDLFEYVVNEKKYKLTINNIECILIKNENEINGNICTQNYQCILNSCNDALLSYVNDNFDLYIDLIYSEDNDIKYILDQSVINKLMLDENISFESKKKILKYETNNPTFDEKLNSELLAYMLVTCNIDLNYTEDEFVGLKNKVDEKTLIDFLIQIDYLRALGNKIYDFSEENIYYIFMNVTLDNCMDIIKNESLSIKEFYHDKNKMKILLQNNKIKFEENILKDFETSDEVLLYANNFKDSYLANVSSLNYMDVAKLLENDVFDNNDLFKFIYHLDDLIFEEALKYNKSIIKKLNDYVLSKNKMYIIIQNCDDELFLINYIYKNRKIMDIDRVKEYVRSISLETIEKCAPAVKSFITRIKK